MSYGEGVYTEIKADRCKNHQSKHGRSKLFALNAMQEGDGDDAEKAEMKTLTHLASYPTPAASFFGSMRLDRRV